MFIKRFSLCICSVLSAFALTSCTAQAQPAPQTPLVRIGQTSTAPVIDGKLNDAAWNQGVAIGDFSVTGSKKPANEATQVRFVYDAQNLYVSWRCEESLLVVAGQRMHEVRINAKKQDDNVVADDSVELFLQSGDNAKIREFDINSIGTLFDAQSDKSDLWKTRDASWNSDAKAAAVQEDGYWTAEIAIPWNAFGLNNPPANGASWALGLARNAVGRGEVSGWNQNDSVAIHRMTNFGTLVFGDHVPDITSQTLPAFEAGKSTFTVQASQPVQANVDLTGDKKTEQFTSSSSDKNIAVPISTSAAKVLFQWSAKDGEKYLYRSPQLSISAQSSLAHLTIITTAAWKLFVNGAQSSDGNAAQNQDVAFPLADGINDIVVQTQSGQAKLQLQPPGFSPNENVAWRTHDVDTKVLSETDRRSWQVATDQNGTIGTAGAPAYLQHTLLNKSTLSYPVESPAFYIAQGSSQQITFLANGIDGIRFDDWQMSIAVPPQYEVLGSSGFYGNSIAGKPKFNSSKIGNTTIDGKPMTLYRITADHPIKYNAKPNVTLTSFEVSFRLPKTAKLNTSEQSTFYFWTDANKNAVSEAPQSIAVRALPPLNGKQPKKFVWEMWSGNARSPQYDDAALVKDILNTSRQAGFNKYQSSDNAQFNDEVRTYGMEPFALISFKDGNILDIVKPYLTKHPEEALVDKDGERSDQFINTTDVLGKDWPMFEKWIEDYTKNSGAAAIEYDYEFPPFGPPHADFSAKSLAAFRDFAKLDTSVELTSMTIQKTYSKQWIDFMAYRTATLLKKMKDAVHAANPKVLFTAYSGYYNATDNTTKSRYGLDWNLVGQMQSVDEAGMGYGRPVPGITESIKALRGIPAVFGEILTPYDKHSRQPVAPMLKASLLRRALDATKGVLVYSRPAIDGRSWTAVADVSRLTADYEDVFLHNTLVDIPGQDAANVQIAKGEGKTLLCVMNPSGSKESTYSIQIPKALGNGKEYYSGEAVKGGQKLQLKLAPGDAKVFVFDR